MYSPSQKKDTHLKLGYLLVKVLQFLPYLNETWAKLIAHELVILTKFHKDKAKIDELLLTANFGMCALFLFFFKFDSDSIIKICLKVNLATNVKTGT